MTLYELPTLAGLGDDDIRGLTPRLMCNPWGPCGVYFVGELTEHYLPWLGGYEDGRPSWSDGMDRRAARIKSAERIIKEGGNAEYLAETYCRMQADLWRLAAEISAWNYEILKQKGEVPNG